MYEIIDFGEFVIYFGYLSFVTSKTVKTIETIPTNEGSLRLLLFGEPASRQQELPQQRGVARIPILKFVLVFKF